MTAKRAVPLTKEEVRERNRLYKQAQRDRGNNHYTRAYRRSQQRAVAWLQENRPKVWEQILKEELAKSSPNPREPCLHPHVHVVGAAYACTSCGQMVGTATLADPEVVHDVMAAIEEYSAVSV